MMIRFAKFGEYVYIITKLEHFSNAKFTIVYTIVDGATEQVKATQENATEAPFSNEYDNFFDYSKLNQAIIMNEN